jgi:hypothetical protein
MTTYLNNLTVIYLYTLIILLYHSVIYFLNSQEIIDAQSTMDISISQEIRITVMLYRKLIKNVLKRNTKPNHAGSVVMEI